MIEFKSNTPQELIDYLEEILTDTGDSFKVIKSKGCYNPYKTGSGKK